MGFRVGMNCFDTRLQADDYLLSSLPPTVTQDGKIIRPERVGFERKAGYVVLSGMFQF